jgi:uncharacterized membrane protein YoaK (UPF0700 family)
MAMVQIIVRAQKDVRAGPIGTQFVNGHIFKEINNLEQPLKKKEEKKKKRSDRYSLGK